MPCFRGCSTLPLRCDLFYCMKKEFGASCFSLFMFSFCKFSGLTKIFLEPVLKKYLNEATNRRGFQYLTVRKNWNCSSYFYKVINKYQSRFVFYDIGFHIIDGVLQRYKPSHNIARELKTVQLIVNRIMYMAQLVNLLLSVLASRNNP